MSTTLLAIPNAKATLDWFAPRAIPGMEAVGEDHYARVLATASGTHTVHARVRGDAVEIASECAEAASQLATAWSAVAPDALDAADAHLREMAIRHEIPLLAQLIAETGPLPLPGCADPHEMVARAIIGQQISVAAATKQLALLVTLGNAYNRDGFTRVFPTNAAIAAGAAEVLRGPATKSEALQRVAGALDRGELDVSRIADFASMHDALIAYKGIGPWTAGYITLRLGNPDVALFGDSAVRAGARRLGITDLVVFSARCAPYRSHLMLRLWQATTSAALAGAPASPAQQK